MLQLGLNTKSELISILQQLQMRFIQAELVQTYKFSTRMLRVCIQCAWHTVDAQLDFSNGAQNVIGFKMKKENETKTNYRRHHEQ